jgi:hypothetical protein
MKVQFHCQLLYTTVRCNTRLSTLIRASSSELQKCYVPLTYFELSYTHLIHTASKHSMSDEFLTRAYCSVERGQLSRYSDWAMRFTYEESWFDCCKGKKIYLFSKRRRPCLKPNQPPVEGYELFFLGKYRGRSVKLAIHYCLVTRRSYPSTTPYVFMACTGTNLPSHFYYSLTKAVILCVFLVLSATL